MLMDDQTRLAGGTAALDRVLDRNRAGEQQGLYCVCSAHPMVIDAALGLARDRRQIAVVEATCNQVNQEGGYTGLLPADFAAMVRRSARHAGLSETHLILGGDHLGPQPWRKKGAQAAMDKAEAMVDAYVRAGFTKIHLDCSMACADDPAIQPEETVAARAVRLAQTAERAAKETGTSLRYIIGTEVPPPGGMGSGHEIVPTAPDHAERTWALHREAFARSGLSQAFERVVAIVVQPGLDFGNEDVVHFDPQSAAALSARLSVLGRAVYEAHSTDYQHPAAFASLVANHFAILKVGPAATFALREALFALEAIERELSPENPSTLRATVDAAMREQPGHWAGHYGGNDRDMAYLRAFSLSDRIRYYWTAPAVASAVGALLANLSVRPIPLPLISQYFPQHAPSVAEGRIEPSPAALIGANIERALAPYADACGTHFPHAQE